MLPSAFRRKSDANAGKKGNAAGLAALTKEETPTAQSVVATTSPAPAAPAPVAEKTAAAPQRPPPRPSEAGAVPQLNRYVRSQLPKGEVRMPLRPLLAWVTDMSENRRHCDFVHEIIMLFADRHVP